MQRAPARPSATSPSPDTTGKQASLFMSGSKNAAIGSITAVGSLDKIDAPNAQLTGALNVDGLSELTLSSTDQAVLTIGNLVPTTNILIATANRHFCRSHIRPDHSLQAMAKQRWAGRHDYRAEYQ